MLSRNTLIVVGCSLFPLVGWAQRQETMQPGTLEPGTVQQPRTREPGTMQQPGGRQPGSMQEGTREPGGAMQQPGSPGTAQPGGTGTMQDTPGSAQQAPTGTTGALDSTDAEFVNKAAAGGLAEVKLGQLAVEKATSPKVKEIGSKMIKDHTKANTQLEKIAKKEGIELPTTMTEEDQAVYDKLSKLSGSEFDSAYLQHMAEDHEKDIEAFRTESKTGTNKSVKTFARKHLPTLEAHKKLIHKHEKQM